MGTGERPAACTGEFLQLFGAKQGQVDRALAIPELAHVVVFPLAIQAGHPAPTEQHVAGGLYGTLALDDALAVLLEFALAQKAFEDRLLSLFHLQHQRVVLVGALHDDYPSARAHAADAYHLVGHIDWFVFAHKQLLVGVEGRAVLGQNRAHQPFDRLRVEMLGNEPRCLLLYQLSHGDDDGRIAHDAQLAIFDLSELADGSRVVLALGFGNRLIRLLPVLGVKIGCHLFAQLVHIEMLVPYVQVPHVGELRHALAVPSHACEHGGFALLL